MLNPSTHLHQILEYIPSTVLVGLDEHHPDSDKKVEPRNDVSSVLYQLIQVGNLKKINNLKQIKNWKLKLKIKKNP